MSDAGDERERGDGKAGVAPWESRLRESNLPKRFYRSVGVERCGDGAAWCVLLDGRPLRTPAKRAFEVESEAVAVAVAAEWDGVASRVDPTKMPLTRLINSALDGVAGRIVEVRVDIVAHAATDLVCYRAERPEGLVRLQSEHWDPVLTWAAASLGARMITVRGIVHASQPAEALSAVARAVAAGGALRLAALHAVTTLTGSALLALRLARGAASAEATWRAAHVDEDWQIAQWGEVEEATAKRLERWREMQAACVVLTETRA